jgi:hypothetical protein
VTDQRFEAIDYSYPYLVDSITFTAPTPHYKYYTNLFEIFDKFIWIAIIVSNILMFTTIKYIQASKTCQANHWRLTLAIIRQTFNAKHYKTFTIQIVITTWLFAGMILGHCYGGSVYSWLAVPHLVQINSISKLINAVKEHDLRVITFRDSNYYLIKVIF